MFCKRLYGKPQINMNRHFKYLVLTVMRLSRMLNAIVFAGFTVGFGVCVFAGESEAAGENVSYGFDFGSQTINPLPEWFTLVEDDAAVVTA